jgi:hypothetical protein
MFARIVIVLPIEHPDGEGMTAKPAVQFWEMIPANVVRPSAALTVTRDESPALL